MDMKMLKDKVLKLFEETSRQSWNDGYEKGRKDASIVRQSVSGEEVATAIADLEEAESIENRMYYSDNVQKSEHELNIETIWLAIAALQEYQPWILVSERLSESDVGYQNLVLALDSSGSYEIEMPSHIIRNIEDYTHWKPLPKPIERRMSDEGSV
jgi:hypothetical protein